MCTGGALTGDEAASAMTDIMGGTATDAQKGAFLSALRLDTVTPEVIASCARVMREHALPCQPPCEVIDVVGTGGDGIDTFNVSTAASIVVAAAGGRVLKHGNRSNSSKCGSADILEALGADLSVDGPAAVKIMEECGFCFLFAQKFHPAMKHVAQVRRQLGTRTIFNILGPLTNPAQASYYATGVFSKSLGSVYAQTFLHMGVKRAVVLHSEEGLDEMSTELPTHAWIVTDGKIEEQDLTPEQFGLPRHPLSSVAGGEPEENVATFRGVVSGERGPVFDYVVLNAAVALWISGLADSPKAAAALASDAILSGKAKTVLETYVKLSNELSGTSAGSLKKGKVSILDQIANETRTQRVPSKKAAVSERDLLVTALSGSVRPAINVVDRVKAALANGSKTAVMAEIKRASPSKGVINGDVNVPQQASQYAAAGAAVISVLTEPNHFKGTIADLRAVTDTLADLPNRPAVLLKDFVVDEYQIFEARANGADLVLLIVAILSDEELSSLLATARSLGMEPLVEVANVEETKRAVSIGARFIGVNNRDLHTFTIDMSRTETLSDLMPSDVVFAALSGIKYVF